MTTRRDVLRGLSGLVVIGAVPTAACGGGGDDGPMDSSTGMDSSMMDSSMMDSSMMDSSMSDSSTDGSSSCDQINHTTNIHTHGLTIPPADVVDGTQKSYTLTGGHSHSITVTAAMFTMLQNGQTVMLTSGGASTGSAHTHMVTLTCG